MLRIEVFATRYWCNCSTAESGLTAHGFKSLRALSRIRPLVTFLNASLLPFGFLISRNAYDYKVFVRSPCRS